VPPGAWGAVDHAGEADVALVCTSKPAAIEAGFRALAPGGTLVLYGVPEPGDELRLDALDHYVRELTVVPSYSAGPGDMHAALDLLGEVDPSPLVTHRFGLHEVARALEVQRTGEGVKALVVP
jgi:L-iditol 2-dehydrogenase